MESFFKTGDFFAESGVQRREPMKMPRRYFSLINIIVWSIVVLVPVFYYLTRLITSGSTLYISIGILIISFCESFFSCEFIFITKNVENISLKLPLLFFKLLLNGYSDIPHGKRTDLFRIQETK